jgi:hypothetical protein
VRNLRDGSMTIVDVASKDVLGVVVVPRNRIGCNAEVVAESALTIPEWLRARIADRAKKYGDAMTGYALG